MSEIRKDWKLLTLGLILYASWFLATYCLSGLYALPSPDGAQYYLPTIVARHPLDLTLPMVGSFFGFDHVWGLQCIGSVVLTKLLTWPLPWSYPLQIVTSLIFLSLIGAALGWFLWLITARPWYFLIGAFLILGNLCYIGIAIAFRPELFCTPLLIFVVVVLGRLLAGELLTFSSKVWAAVSCAVLATLHPYAIGLTGGLLGLAFIIQLIRRNPLRTLSLFGIGYVLGLGAMVFYFLLQPDAVLQFQKNAQLQMTFNVGHWTFLSHPQQRLGAEWPWWIGGLVASLFLIVDLVRGRLRTAGAQTWMLVLCVAIYSGVLMLGFLLRTENPGHTMLALPFVLTLCLSGVERLRASLLIRRQWLVPAMLVMLLGWYYLWMPVRLHRWRNEGYINIPKTLTAFVDSLPPARMTYIPLTLWNPVLGHDLARYKFFTFPLPWWDASRLDYEESFRKEARPGDLLVVDLAHLKNDKFHAIPLMPVNPPDPSTWVFLRRETRTFPGSIPWGWDYRVYQKLP